MMLYKRESTNYLNRFITSYTFSLNGNNETPLSDVKGTKKIYTKMLLNVIGRWW
jgi:hypothetical protein